MKKLRNLITSAMTLAFMPVMAQQVSPMEAQARAEAFLQQTARQAAPRQGSGTSVHLELAYTSQRPSDQRPLYYAFNRGEGQGFIIVGGDESAVEILGYSESGNFDINNIPENFRWWLSQYDAQISAGIDQGAVSRGPRQAVLRRAASAGRHDIAPLVEAKWNQEAPYNNEVNAALRSQTGLSGYNFVTGCVATAMAQVMKHHEWPLQGTGQHTSYTTIYNGGEFSFTPSANFGVTTYDWDNMRVLSDKESDSYSGSYTTAEANAVATLMYHVGVSVDMKYGNSSGAAPFRIARALSSYFDYDKSMSYEERMYYSDDEWEDLIYNELENGRPVLYGGQATNGGHQFICDGYRTSDHLYSFNWGWGSYCDGWYAITGQYALKPSGSGIGGAGAGSAYTGDQDITINVMPNQGGKERPLLKAHGAGTTSLFVNNQKVNSYSYTKSETDAPATIVASDIYNFSLSLTQFTMGVRAYDRNTGMVYYWTCQNASYSLPTFTGPTSYSYSPRTASLSINLRDLAYNGTYELRPVVRPQGSTSDEDWVPVRTFKDDVIPQVIVTGASAVEAKPITFSLSNNKVQVGRQITIEHDASYKGEIAYTGYDNTIVSVDANGVIKGLKEGTTTITVTGEDYSVNGNLLFTKTTKDISVTVIATVKTNPVITIESTALTTGGTTQISVEGYEGDASEITYTSSNTNVATVTDGLVTAVGEGTTTITVTVPETATSNAKTQEFVVTVSGYQIQIVDNPYMTNEIDDLLTLYIPMKNVGTSSASESFWMQYVVGHSYWSYHSSLSLPAGFNYTISLDFAEDEEDMRDGDKITIRFYRDADCTIPANVPEYSFTYHTTVPDYTLTDAGWGTITMPVACDLPTGVDWKFYSCTSVQDDILVLTEVTTLERNTPYIVSGTAGTGSFTASKWVDSRKLFTQGVLTGVLSDEAYKFQPSDYILQKQGNNVAFYQVTTASPKLGQAAAPLRAFLRLPEGVATNLAVFFPQPNAITTVEGETPTLPAGIYGFDGSQRAALQSGMNIVVSEDGSVKKFFVK